MKISFDHASQLAKRRGTMIFPNTIIRADEIEVLGNWNKKDVLRLHFKNGNGTDVKKIDIVRCIQMYLASLNGEITDYFSFEPNLLGYKQKFHSGFLLFPDLHGSCLGILAENVSTLTNQSTEKKKSIRIKTKTNKIFNAEIGFEDAKAAYKEAIQGQNAVIWHKDWPFEKPILDRIIKPRPSQQKIKIT
jgi:hypothetical protein